MAAKAAAAAEAKGKEQAAEWAALGEVCSRAEEASEVETVEGAEVLAAEVAKAAAALAAAAGAAGEGWGAVDTAAHRFGLGTDCLRRVPKIPSRHLLFAGRAPSTGCRPMVRRCCSSRTRTESCMFLRPCCRSRRPESRWAARGSRPAHNESRTALRWRRASFRRRARKTQKALDRVLLRKAVENPPRLLGRQ